MKTKFCTLTLLFLCLLIGCTSAAPPAAEPTEAPGASVTLNIFAAASLTESFTELGKQFEAQHPGTTLVYNFASSSQLSQQIIEGASADVFASANETQMNKVVEGGRITAGSPHIFVTNRLVVIYPAGNPAGLMTLQDLTKPGLRLVFAAEEVPVGQYSLEFLDKALLDPAYSPTFKEEVLGNVVSYEQDVKSVLAKVILGEADAGIVYSSDVTGENASNVGNIAIPDALNVIATYPIASVANSAHADLANAFVAFVLSPEGQKILAENGFIPVVENQ
ncbi:MAG: molybdate ABC transporter substrate-binding protein [Anaerolineales bacterium]